MTGFAIKGMDGMHIRTVTALTVTVAVYVLGIDPAFGWQSKHERSEY